MLCIYCGSLALKTAYTREFHKVDRTFGPFDLCECTSCGSLLTENPPTPERLGEFYRNYHRFRPDWYTAAALSGALSSQYRFYARLLAKVMKKQTRWLDVGAGHGEVANVLADSCPQGLAADIGGRPDSLDATVGYREIDLNSAGWADSLNDEFDHVFSVAVWEHVLAPVEFARNCLSLVAKGGTLTLICPDYGSLARKVTRRRWPYFEPGEHISIPTRSGANACLDRATRDLGLDDHRIMVRTLNVGYSLRYLANVLRLNAVASLIPPDLAAPLPTGLLIAVVQRR